MLNSQSLDHTDILSKYVCEYIGKFYEGNYVVIFQDTHNGQWVLGKPHLHNTHIFCSNINEQKAYKQNRRNIHPRARDMTHFDIYQIL